MARNNFVYLRGYPIQPAYFDRVPDRERQTLTAFLKFHVRVPRDRSQPRAFPDDTIRVVAYGSLAEDSYPLLILEAKLPVNVTGWIQFRTFQGKPILEVVAEAIQRAVSNPKEMEQLRTSLGVEGEATKQP
jgi:hypothetical protein